MDLSKYSKNDLVALQRRVRAELADRLAHQKVSDTTMLSVCDAGADCPCFYRVNPYHDNEDEEEYVFDPCALIVYGLYDYESQREIHKELKPQVRGCIKIYVTRDCSKAFLHFHDREAAATAQSDLYHLGYQVNAVIARDR